MTASTFNPLPTANTQWVDEYANEAIITMTRLNKQCRKLLSSLEREPYNNYFSSVNSAFSSVVTEEKSILDSLEQDKYNSESTDQNKLSVLLQQVQKLQPVLNDVLALCKAAAKDGPFINCEEFLSQATKIAVELSVFHYDLNIAFATFDQQRLNAINQINADIKTYVSSCVQTEEKLLHLNNWFNHLEFKTLDLDGFFKFDFAKHAEKHVARIHDYCEDMNNLKESYANAILQNVYPTNIDPRIAGSAMYRMGVTLPNGNRLMDDQNFITAAVRDATCRSQLINRHSIMFRPTLEGASPYRSMIAQDPALLPYLHALYIKKYIKELLAHTINRNIQENLKTLNGLMRKSEKEALKQLEDHLTQKKNTLTDFCDRLTTLLTIKAEKQQQALSEREQVSIRAANTNNGLSFHSPVPMVDNANKEDKKDNTQHLEINSSNNINCKK